MRVGPNMSIEEVSLIDAKTGEKKLLTEKMDSRCFFREPIETSKHWIQLRIDHNNNLSGDPILDADIYKLPKIKKNKVKNGPWHHTSKEQDANGLWIYHFTFEDIDIKLVMKRTVSASITSDVRFVKKGNSESR